MKQDLPPVKILVLTLTGRCNFACRYCYASGQDESDLSEEDALAALHMAGESRERFILQFSGGEPLLMFPLIRTIVKETEKAGYPAQMQIQTNGALLTRPIARWLYDHNVGIGLSLDGKPAVNDRQRISRDGKSAAAAAARGFTALREEGIACGLTCVVTSENVARLSSIADMAYFFGNVHQIGFDILREQGRGMAMKAPSPEDMKTALAGVEERLRLFETLTGRKVGLTQAERPRAITQSGSYEFPQCYAMRGEAVYVDVHGGLYACSSLMGNPYFRIGTARGGRDPEAVRAAAAHIETAMKECRCCPYFRRCGGGCFSRWYRKDHSVKKSGAECAMKEYFIKAESGQA